ncbi:ATP-dependent DNA helicase [Parenemella sanctibonifatiensis]|uniref:DNA 3'-5' helicase n=1 Tax=Parenemella sanctibonifatiensis TaxID=2016505 RepID=A0A255EB68_9ACTN|nr:ATP-dependent DNA helicase [Parenemella sanctibonifatiensis]OYN86652.1 ATP-dependent DNA helicase [Parenemella sanctibonifatiensis]
MTPALTRPEDVKDVLGIPFSDEQLEAITAPLEPTVIIAGAGTGKTTVMAARVVWLVGSGQVRPEQVLGLTFTRKAASELSDRVRSALKRAGVVDTSTVDESGEQVVMTYDAFAARLVSEHGARIGVESDAVMISGAARFRLASRAVTAAVGPFIHLPRLRPDTVTERVLALDAQLQSNLVDAGDIHALTDALASHIENAPRNRQGNVYASIKDMTAASHERIELVDLVQDYQALKRRLGVVEFADQMATAARLVDEAPEVPALVRDQFAVVLLDEYQDTSSAQAQLLRGLFSGPDPEQGRGHPVTAVGDPFQAIYGWRGAAASNITAFAQDFPKTDGSAATRQALTINRRSGPAILDVANTLAEPLRADPAMSGVGRELVAPPGTPVGTIRAASFATWPEEVAWITDQIAAAHHRGPRRIAQAGETVTRWSDIAVLSRRNADIATIYAALSARDIPAEIVGLGGLLGLPEVADVVATLRLIDDVTANPAVVRLLSGSRWSLDPADLELLGRRARQLAGTGTGVPLSEADEMAVAAMGTDPADLICLMDAIDDPGDLDYSPRGRAVIDQFGAELRHLRRLGDQTVVDLTRRVITTLGLEQEIHASPTLSRGTRAEQLAAFVDAVADYVDVDGDGSLGGLLAYLDDERERGVGLEQALPTGEDSVKLLTIHRAKGLEWEMVFLPSLTAKTFPSDRGASVWPTSADTLPAVLRGDADAIPQLTEVSDAGIKKYKQALSKEDRRSEDRLAYVAVTRARRVLIGTTHTWRPDTQRPRESSDYLVPIWAAAEAADQLGAVAADRAETNPLVTQARPVPWPDQFDPDAYARRVAAADAVRRQRDQISRGQPEPGWSDPELNLDEYALVQAWDADVERLLTEARQQREEPELAPLPGVIAATSVERILRDEDGYRRELQRPMPRPPSATARLGNLFHAWIEQQLGQDQLVDPDDLPDRVDLDITDEADLRHLQQQFLTSSYAQRKPLAVEMPFQLHLPAHQQPGGDLIPGRVIRGRIDAVYAGTDGHRFQVVDWKTGGGDRADPYQLAIYRLALADMHEVAVEEVDAVFHFVRSGRTVRPESYASREELIQILSGPVDGQQ